MSNETELRAAADRVKSAMEDASRYESVSASVPIDDLRVILAALQPPAAESGEGRSIRIDREMTEELDRRRVLTLARLLPMLSLMAGGEAFEVVGYDPAELHAEVLMALGIEDEDNPETMAEVIVELDGKSGHGILDRFTPTPAIETPGISDATRRMEQTLGAPFVRRDSATPGIESGAGLDTETAAWAWIEKTYGSGSDDPVDRAYAADEMVDAFHAGKALKLTPKAPTTPGIEGDEARAAFERVTRLADTLASDVPITAAARGHIDAAYAYLRAFAKPSPASEAEARA